jgi:aminodeoxyfutalosine deaminase
MPSPLLRLFSAPWVLPICESPIAEGAIVLDDSDRIVAVGSNVEMRQRFGGATNTRVEGAMMPALVNAHTHLELSALQVPAQAAAGFIPWAADLMKRITGLAPDLRQAAIASAISSLEHAGVGAIGDVGNTTASVVSIAASPLVGTFFHELTGMRQRQTGDAITSAQSERASIPGAWPDRIRYTIAPHALYSADPALLRDIFTATANYETPTSIHVAEDRDEIEFLRYGSGPWKRTLAQMGFDPQHRCPGTGPLRYLRDLGAFNTNRPPLLVHMVHADHEDRTIAADAGATVVLCPRSNIAIGGQLPDVPALLSAGISIAVGTDSLASSPSLSPWEEIAVLAGAFPNVSSATWLRAVTLGGALGMHLHDMGTLAPGKRPGIIAVGPVGIADPVAHLVSHPPSTVSWIARPWNST